MKIICFYCQGRNLHIPYRTKKCRTKVTKISSGKSFVWRNILSDEKFCSNVAGWYFSHVWYKWKITTRRKPSGKSHTIISKNLLKIYCSTSKRLFYFFIHMFWISDSLSNSYWLFIIFLPVIKNPKKKNILDLNKIFRQSLFFVGH